jgi:hypothetical protein
MSDKIRNKREAHFREDIDSDLPARSEKGILSGKFIKGLRNLSVKVREIVCELKATSYKEVAERLIRLLWEANKMGSNVGINRLIFRNQRMSRT